MPSEPEQTLGYGRRSNASLVVVVVVIVVVDVVSLVARSLHAVVTGLLLSPTSLQEPTIVRRRRYPETADRRATSCGGGGVGSSRCMMGSRCVLRRGRRSELVVVRRLARRALGPTSVRPACCVARTPGVNRVFRLRCSAVASRSGGGGGTGGRGEVNPRAPSLGRHAREHAARPRRRRLVAHLRDVIAAPRDRRRRRSRRISRRTRHGGT